MNSCSSFQRENIGLPPSQLAMMNICLRLYMPERWPEATRNARYGSHKLYLSYMEQMFVYFEKSSLDVVGYEVKQILLLHADTLNADYLRELVLMMRARGYRFISLRSALKDRAYQRADADDSDGESWIIRWAHTAGREEPGEPEIPEFVIQQYLSTTEQPVTRPSHN